VEVGCQSLTSYPAAAITIKGSDSLTRGREVSVELSVKNSKSVNELLLSYKQIAENNDKYFIKTVHII
jgi:hypothetical protein